MKKIRSQLLSLLDDAMWKIFMKRRPIDYERIAYFIAAEESARFYLKEMNKADNHVTRNRLLLASIKAVTIDGLWLEFGVHRGESLRIIGSKAKSTVYGFDSFEGLPEDWTSFQKKGRFSLGGVLPGNMPLNVELIKGWFDRTLPKFTQEHKSPVAFLHIDSDLYSSAKTIFSELRNQILPGTIILFDELVNYPGWMDGEYKAFMEYVAESSRSYEYIGFASSGHSVAVRITG